MTPMIDVTFLLLIFFMTVNQMSKMNKEAMPLPTLKGTQDQSDGSLTINVNREAEIVVSAKSVTVPELIGLVTETLAANNNDPQQVTIVLRAHRDGDCRTVNEVVRDAQQAGHHPRPNGRGEARHEAHQSRPRRSSKCR